MAKVIQMPNVTKNQKKSKARQLVYQGNPLIQSRKYFNTFGTRLFILGLMTINPHLSKKDKYFDSEFPDVHISTKELTKLFGNTAYLGNLEQECEKLFNSSIKLKYTDKSFILMHIFDVMKYRANDGLYIKFDPKMKPYLLELIKGEYTAVNIEQIFRLTSTYAVRLIELCLQYRNVSKGAVITRKFSLEELRFYLNVPDDSYVGRMDHFKKFVLDDPIAEMERITDFRMTYRTEKEGRKIKNFIIELDTSLVSDEKFDIKFTLGKKIPAIIPFADIYSELINQGFSARSAKDILKTVNDNVEVSLRLEYALKIFPEYSKKKSVKNKQGFLRKAILENWRKNDVKSKNDMNISKDSKKKNQVTLNSLDFEKETMQRRIADANEAMEKTGISPDDLLENELPLTSYVVKMVSEEILRGGELSDGAKKFLNIFHFTPERFKQVYMKKDLKEVEKTPLNESYGVYRLVDALKVNNFL